MHRAWLALTGLALLAAGCARPQPYWNNRWRDFAQCFTLTAGIGVGLDVKTNLTDWVGTGVGASLSVEYGFAGHPIPPDSPEGDLHAGFPIRQLGLVCGFEWAELDLPRGVPRFLITDATWGTERRRASVLFLNLTALREGGGRPRDVKTADRFGMDIGATLLVPSFRVGFNPARFLDFLLGWTTLDIAGDDEAGQSPPPPTPQDTRKDATPCS